MINPFTNNFFELFIDNNHKIVFFNSNCIIDKNNQVLFISGRVTNNLSVCEFNKFVSPFNVLGKLKKSIKYFNNNGVFSNNVGYLVFNNKKYYINTDIFGNFDLVFPISITYEYKKHFSNKTIDVTILNTLTNKYYSPYITTINDNDCNILISNIEGTLINIDTFNEHKFVSFLDLDFNINKPISDYIKYMTTYLNINNFHYISSFPYSLYVPISEFIFKFVNNGTIYMKKYNVTNINDFFQHFVRNYEFVMPILTKIIKTKMCNIIFMCGNTQHELYTCCNLYKKYNNVFKLFVIKNNNCCNNELILHNLNIIPKNKIIIID